MKKLFLIAAAMFAAVSFSACSDDDDNEGGSDLARPALPDPNDICSCMDDLYVMDYCYVIIDVNKDGKVSKAEAEAVKTMDLLDFDSDWYNPYDNKAAKIESLKGIGYFVNLERLDCSGCTSLTEVDLSQNVKLTTVLFVSCETLERVTLPNTIRFVDFDCENMKEIYCKSSTPPSFYDYRTLPSSVKIYVPTKSVNAYKTAEDWEEYADQIFGYDF